MKIKVLFARSWLRKITLQWRLAKLRENEPLESNEAVLIVIWQNKKETSVVQ